MEKYVIGNCRGCVKQSAASLYVDQDHAGEVTMEFMESGHDVKIIETDKVVGVEGCTCKRLVLDENTPTILVNCPVCRGPHFNFTHSGILVCASVMDGRTIGCGWKGKPCKS